MGAVSGAGRRGCRARLPGARAPGDGLRALHPPAVDRRHRRPHDDGRGASRLASRSPIRRSSSSPASARTRRSVQRAAREAATARGDGRQAAARASSTAGSAAGHRPTRSICGNSPSCAGGCRRFPTHEIVAEIRTRPRRRSAGHRPVPGRRQPMHAGLVGDRPHRALAPGLRRGRREPVRRKRAHDRCRADSRTVELRRRAGDRGCGR